MSYNGSGVYTLPGAALANGEIVSATENNTFRNDVASALNVAWTRDGQAPATANIPMGAHKFTGLAAGTGNGDSVRYEQTTLKTGATASSALPSGTTAQRDATPASGYIRFNSDNGNFEGYNGTTWGSVGTLDNNSVTTAKIADANVTYAKIQNVTAGKVLGRDTSGAGVVQELPIAVDSSGNVGIGGASGGGKLEVYTANTANAGNKVKIQGYQAGYEILNAAQTQNWYMGVADADANKLYIGKGYGVGQNIAPSVKIDTSENFSFNSGYGSAAIAYGCRAWVNFNGTGTVAIRASGNVSSITDNGTGDYTVNLTNAMPDANYCIQATNGDTSDTVGGCLIRGTPTTSAYRFLTGRTSGQGPSDRPYINSAIFR